MMMVVACVVVCYPGATALVKEDVKDWSVSVLDILCIASASRVQP